MEDRMPRTVVILVIVIVWAFILTKNSMGEIYATRSEIDAYASLWNPIYRTVESRDARYRPIEKGGEIFGKLKN